MPMRGQSLELFFIDGIPEGMVTATMFNWTGHILLTPRIRLADALKRTEASFTGVYVLLGESDEGSQVREYIGEGEDVADRIRKHDATKEWWDSAILITSSANNLNKAHIKFLETRLIQEAVRVGTMVLDNIVTPARPSLSEADEAKMEQFLDYLLSAFPAIRVDGFLIKTRPTPNSDSAKIADSTKKPAEFRLKTGEDVAAIANVVNGEFIVQPGSFGRAGWIGVEHNYKRLFNEVVESGAYVQEGTRRKFTKAYAFSSASAAGAVLNGRATTGPLAWTLASDPEKTYKDWEADQLKN